MGGLGTLSFDATRTLRFARRVRVRWCGNLVRRMQLVRRSPRRPVRLCSVLPLR